MLEQVNGCRWWECETLILRIMGPQSTCAIQFCGNGFEQFHKCAVQIGVYAFQTKIAKHLRAHVDNFMRA